MGVGYEALTPSFSISFRQVFSLLFWHLSITCLYSLHVATEASFFFHQVYIDSAYGIKIQALRWWSDHCCHSRCSYPRRTGHRYKIISRYLHFQSFLHRASLGSLFENQVLWFGKLCFIVLLSKCIQHGLCSHGPFNHAKVSWSAWAMANIFVRQHRSLFSSLHSIAGKRSNGCQDLS